MKKTSLMLAMVLGLVVMLTFFGSVQAQAQAVSLACTINGDEIEPSGTWNILIEADMSMVTVFIPNDGKMYFPHNGTTNIGSTKYTNATSAMYEFGEYGPGNRPGKRFEIDRISGKITFIASDLGRTYTGTCTKTEIHPKF